MATFFGAALGIAFAYWVVWTLRRLPEAIKNILAIGGGFCLLALQIGVLALMVGGLVTSPGGVSLGGIVSFSVVAAMAMIWNAFLSLNIAHRLIALGVYKGMQEQRMASRAETVRTIMGHH